MKKRNCANFLFFATLLSVSGPILSACSNSNANQVLIGVPSPVSNRQYETMNQIPTMHNKLLQNSPNNKQLSDRGLFTSITH